MDVKRGRSRTALTPQEIAPRHPGIDAALAEALDDERAGRLSPRFASVEELEAWLKTEEGKKVQRRVAHPK